MRALSGLVVLSVVFVGVVGCQGPRVTTGSLLSEMTDLSALAEYPDPPFTCKQFSSYDRKSVTADDHAGWFANADCGQYLRVEERDGRKEHVMADMDGPGAIVRIWSANPKGTLRIYLDNSETPVIEAPMTELLGGTYAGVPKPIACERSRGWNSYLPIPYAKHCKITSDEGGFYYHVNYRTYPPDTVIKSFTADDLELLSDQITEVAASLASPYKCGVETIAWSYEPGLKVLQEHMGANAKVQMHGCKVQQGKNTVCRTETTNDAAIVGMRVKVDAENVALALRQVVLNISFDGEETVTCPLGDFFGTAPGANAYESLPSGVTADGEMWSHWIMPFDETAEMAFTYNGTQKVMLKWGVVTEDYEWTDRSMHFHAKWRGQFDVPTRPMIDWNYLTATGQGVFVGAAFHIANPVKAWWGEGDEKIYVDGETFPSHFGTGTEDYYGYAWCCNEPFTHAYHNQPRCDGPANYGHTAVNRWHVIDKIPFEQRFKFDMELWHWNAEANVAMSVVSYWYAKPGATDGFPAIDPADLRVTEIPEYKPRRVEGALEGEEMEVLEMTGGSHEVQPWGNLSNEHHRWWRHGKPGDKLTLGFEVEQAGKYRVIARFLTAGDYGIHQLYINGAPAGEPIDLYNPQVKPSDEYDLGTFELAAGQNRITAEIVGANEKAVKSHMLGLDYLRLEAVD